MQPLGRQQRDELISQLKKKCHLNCACINHFVELNSICANNDNKNIYNNVIVIANNLSLE